MVFGCFFCKNVKRVRKKFNAVEFFPFSAFADKKLLLKRLFITHFCRKWAADSELRKTQAYLAILFLYKKITVFFAENALRFLCGHSISFGIVPAHCYSCIYARSTNSWRNVFIKNGCLQWRLAGVGGKLYFAIVFCFQKQLFTYIIFYSFLFIDATVYLGCSTRGNSICKY